MFQNHVFQASQDDSMEAAWNNSWDDVPCLQNPMHWSCFFRVILLRQWAFHVLRRTADLLGEDVVKSRLARSRPVYSLFAGMECVKHGWQFIQAAALELWGIKPSVEWEFSVMASYRIDVSFECFHAVKWFWFWICLLWTVRWRKTRGARLSWPHGSRMVASSGMWWLWFKTKCRRTNWWNPRQWSSRNQPGALGIKESAPSSSQTQLMALDVWGFHVFFSHGNLDSKPLGPSASKLKLRRGKREGFTNIPKAQCHSVGTRVMQQLAANVHENVPGFDEVPGIDTFSFWFIAVGQAQLTNAPFKMQKARPERQWFCMRSDVSPEGWAHSCSAFHAEEIGTIESHGTPEGLNGLLSLDNTVYCAVVFNISFWAAWWGPHFSRDGGPHLVCARHEATDQGFQSFVLPWRHSRYSEREGSHKDRL